MNIAVVVLMILFTILFPIISLPFNFLIFLFTHKYKKIYAFLMAFSLASIAYVWNPGSEMDLYRWHLEVINFKSFNLHELSEYIKINLEPINYLIKYCVSKTGNVNLLQFIVVFIGYYEILWMFSDYSYRKSIKISAFLITILFVISSLQYIGFISGLWFNFAIINFALGFYLNYERNTKWIHWIFYIVAPLIHISTIFILCLLVFTKMKKRKVKLFSLIIVFIVFLMIGPILTFINSKINIQYIYNLYESYFINGSQFAVLNNGTNLYLAICRLFICLLIVNSVKNNEEKKYNFIIFVIVSVFAILISSTVFVRYAFFVQLISIPLIMDYFNKSVITKKICGIGIVVIIVSLLMFYRQYTSLKTSGIIPSIENNLFNNIFSLKNGAS